MIDYQFDEKLKKVKVIRERIQAEITNLENELTEKSNEIMKSWIGKYLRYYEYKNVGHPVYVKVIGSDGSNFIIESFNTCTNEFEKETRGFWDFKHKIILNRWGSTERQYESITKIEYENGIKRYINSKIHDLIGNLPPFMACAMSTEYKELFRSTTDKLKSTKLILKETEEYKTIKKMCLKNE
jgi:hypothetical protein